MRAILCSWSVSVGITALITGSALGQTAIDATTSSRIDSALAALVEENGVVGLQVAIGIDGTLAWTGAYGMADLEHDSPVTDETLFRTASISKWMTATAALRLVELGRLDLDARRPGVLSRVPGEALDAHRTPPPEAPRGRASVLGL